MRNNYDAFFSLAKEILTHPVYLLQQSYRHHTSTLYDHSLLVAYYAFLVSDRLGLDVRSTIRGALLHDFFLYDWHEEGKARPKPLHRKHGFTHAMTACRNAAFYFSLNAKEKDIIKKHMFPLNVRPPLYLESWVVNTVDSYVTIKEYFKREASIDHEVLRYVHERLADSQHEKKTL